MSDTMTNQASELFELCKEAYERTGWDNNDRYFWSTEGSFIRDEKHKILPNTPLYTSDYLLEKLPQYLVNDNEVYPFILYRGKYSKQWLAGYDGYFGGQSDPSDTPLKVLLKLTIALSKAGELK